MMVLFLQFQLNLKIELNNNHMKKFLITSPVYTGAAAVVYNAEGLLVVIDLTECSMSTLTIHGFKAKIPAHLNELQPAFAGTRATIVEAEYTVNFEDFWRVYDKKINKARCILLWSKMDKTMQVLAFFGVKPYDRFLKKEGYRGKSDPENYLRNRAWENEYK